MAKQNGRDMVINVSDDDGATWKLLAVSTEDSLSCEIGEIDITDKGSNGFRTLLSGGIKSISLSTSGYTDGDDFFTRYNTGGLQLIQVLWGNGATLEGYFEIGSYERTGSNDNSAVEFSASLRSSGTYTFTAGA